MSSEATIPPLFNRIMQFVIKSPLHGLVSKSLLLITFSGRKSGREYTTPVSYSRKNDAVLIFTHANWWRNLLGGVPVRLRLQGKDVSGIANPIADDKAIIAAELTEHLKQAPTDARFYNVTFDDQGVPKSREVEEAVETVAMIRVNLS